MVHRNDIGSNLANIVHELESDIDRRRIDVQKKNFLEILNIGYNPWTNRRIEMFLTLPSSFPFGTRFPIHRGMEIRSISNLIEDHKRSFHKIPSEKMI